MSTFLERMKEEKKELDIKIEKLAVFLSKPNKENLSKKMIDLLISQHNAMAIYSHILEMRIELVEETEEVK